jgi:low affinity Fe/Cu permease
MSLGIFSFDLAALINSLSNFINISQPETVSADLETTLDKTEDVLQNSTATTTAADSKIEDILMAAALDSTITSVISTENTKNPAPLTSTSKPLVPTVTLDEETKKEIERLIKSLQTSVVHNYQSTDIIDETVSLNNTRNFPRRNFREDSENKGAERERKSEEHKLELLREELKKSIMKSNSDV